jgi:hypothetical protein
MRITLYSICKLNITIDNITTFFQLPCCLYARYIGLMLFDSNEQTSANFNISSGADSLAHWAYLVVVLTTRSLSRLQLYT